jgi:nicotinate-nucleotide adenylyltransferase
MEQSSCGGKRVAFFGGSFDPPHHGHLAVARAARDALALDTVLFAPVGAQPLKPQGSTASFEDRVAMTRLAIAGDPGFAVSLADAPKPAAAPNYTIDTLLALRSELPPGGTLFFLMGADSFLSLRRWHKAVEIPFVAPLIVASRPGQPLEDLEAALPQGLTIEPALRAHSFSSESAETSVDVRTFHIYGPGTSTAPLYLLPGLHIDISASQVREQILASPALGSPVPQLLCDSVLDYIRSHGLYR